MCCLARQHDLVLVILRRKNLHNANTESYSGLHHLGSLYVLTIFIKFKYLDLWQLDFHVKTHNYINLGVFPFLPVECLKAFVPPPLEELLWNTWIWL